MDHHALIYGDQDYVRPQKAPQAVTSTVVASHQPTTIASAGAASAAQPVPASLQQRLQQVSENRRKAKVQRKAAGTVWEDPTLDEWPDNDFRVFCGDLGNEVSDEVLATAFKKYPSFVKAKVIRDKRTLKSKGFGFVSFLS